MAPTTTPAARFAIIEGLGLLTQRVDVDPADHDGIACGPSGRSVSLIRQAIRDALGEDNPVCRGPPLSPYSDIYSTPHKHQHQRGCEETNLPRQAAVAVVEVEDLSQ